MAIRARRVDPTAPAEVPGEPFRSDYSDAFAIAPLEPRSAEDWARATLEHGPAALQWFVMFGWRFVLRLRLGPKESDDFVARWPIVLRTHDTVVLGVASGALGQARLTFRTDLAFVSASSDISFTRPVGRALWSVAGLLHRRILPYLLGHAASSARR